MEELNVRDATEADAGAIAAIHAGTWQHAYRGLMPDELLDGLSVENRTARWTRDLSNPMPRTTVLVAEVNGHVQGFIGLGPCSDDDADATTGELYTLYVKPESMGKGIGSALLSAAQQRLEILGFSEATLCVLEGNSPSRAFYAHRGWRDDGATKTENLTEAALSQLRQRISLWVANKGAAEYRQIRSGDLDFHTD